MTLASASWDECGNDGVPLRPTCGNDGAQDIAECTAKICREMARLRTDLSDLVQNCHDGLHEQLTNWTARQDMVTEYSSAFQHRLDSTMRQNTTLLTQLAKLDPLGADVHAESLIEADVETTFNGVTPCDCRGVAIQRPSSPVPPPRGTPPALPKDPAHAAQAQNPPVAVSGSGDAADGCPSGTAPAYERRHTPEGPCDAGEDRASGHGGDASRPMTGSATNSTDPAKPKMSLLPGPSKSKLWDRLPGSKKGKKKKAGQYLIAQKSDVFGSQTWAQAITSSRPFEWTTSILIILNAMSIGWQVEHMAVCAAETYDDTEVPTHFFWIQSFFNVIFVFELGLRWIAEGLFDFFQAQDAGWNLFDFCIVMTGLVEMFVEAFSDESWVASVSVIRVFRVIRIVRVIRIIRVLTFFHELRLMIDSIINSLKCFLWCALVLCILFYIFGICMTTGVSGYLETMHGAKPDDTTLLLEDDFGSLSRSMLSLFMAMSGGRDWAELYEVLERLAFTYRLLFIVFVSFSLFAVVNVVTGVFVESAIATSGKDRDTLIKEELHREQRYLIDMREVFEEMDQDQTDAISLDEFEKHLNDDRVIAYFNTLKLNVSDARTLFLLLDHDRSGSVEIDEFLDGCTRLKGESRSLDIAVMRYELAWLRHSVSDLFNNLMNQRHIVGSVVSDNPGSGEQRSEDETVQQTVQHPNALQDTSSLSAPLGIIDSLTAELT